MLPASVDQFCSCVYDPSRADQRVVRAILGDLRDSEPCLALDHIANGPLGRVVRLLAAIRGLAFIFVAHGPAGASYAFCGPTAESAAELAHSALDLQPPYARPSLSAPSAEGEGRAPVVCDAIERIVLGLQARSDCVFALVWSIERCSDVQLDYSIELGWENSLNWIDWFRSEKLRVKNPPARGHTARDLGACYG